MTVRRGLTLAVLLAVAWLTSSGARAQQDEDHGRDKKLQTLLTQRRETLQERLKFVLAMYKNGRMELQQVIDARNAVLEAEIELASTTERRLALLQERIESLRELETHVRKQQEAVSADYGVTSLDKVYTQTRRNRP